MVTALDQVYQYRVDSKDRITWVSPRWLAFAQENGAPELTEQRVVGRSLWEYVDGDATRAVYEKLHRQVRQQGEPVVVPFRCDSPSLRREMQLTIRSEHEGLLLYESAIVMSAPCSPVNVLDLSLPRSLSFLTMCSCCKRVLIEPDGWLEISDASVRLKVLDTPRPPQLAYDVCPACRQ